MRLIDKLCVYTINYGMSESNFGIDKMIGSEFRVADKIDKSKINRTQEYWENRPEIYQMRYGDFESEYRESMKIAQKKESNGNLDPHHPNYIPMTNEEKALHEQDWKAFSKQRGFSDYDIAEYARWHKISGQTDNLEYAINDPWRRTLSNWEKQLYVKHIEKALGSNIDISQEALRDYKTVKTELESPISNIFMKSSGESCIAGTQEQNASAITSENWDDESWN